MKEDERIETRLGKVEQEMELIYILLQVINKRLGSLESGPSEKIMLDSSPAERTT